MKTTGVKISSIAHYLPPQVVPNQEIIEKYNLRLKDAWVKENIGIEERRWCESNVHASDLGAEVLKKLKLPLDGLVVATVSPDYLTPATAAVIQAKATPGERYPAFDITAACSGFIYALDISQRMVQTGYQNIACIATETRSKYLNKQDRRTVMLFGDGAAGVTLSPCEPGEIGIIDTKLLADGRHYEAIFVNNPCSPISSQQQQSTIQMKDATNIFSAAVQEMENLVLDILNEHKLSPQEIDYFIFHQASKNIVETVAKALKLSQEQYLINFTNRGNMTSASSAVALSEAVELDRIKKGDLVVMLATGGGFSAGVSLFRWEI